MVCTLIRKIDLKKNKKCYIYSYKLNKLLASGGKRKYLWFKDIYKFSGMVLPRYFYMLLMLRAMKQFLKEF